MSLLDSLKRGWWSGWAEPYELLEGGAGLLESLIPGDRPDDPLERVQRWASEHVQGMQYEGGEGRSEGLLEKIAEGLGAAPGTLASMAPFMWAGGGAVGGARAAATLGGRIAGPALGFGVHSLVRHGDEGLPTAIGHGLKGAAEGAVFGGLGAWAGGKAVPPAAKMLLDKRQAMLAHGGERQLMKARVYKDLAEEAGLNTLGRQLQRRGLHGASVGGFIGGMTAAHGGDLEESVAAGTTMGLLGLLSRGKYHEPKWGTERQLADIRPEALKHAERIEAERAAAKDPQTGVPATVTGFHGTDARFEKFSVDDSSIGAFFSSRADVANTFAVSRSKMFGGEPKLLEAEIRFENPLVIDGSGKYAADFQFGPARESLLNDIRAGGHDGVILKNVIDASPSSKIDISGTTDLFIAVDTA
ncbi:MAG: hypothetical protein ACYSTZ_09580, partial [Planctomycetota bacterium]